jgi:hypothetical protein
MHPPASQVDATLASRWIIHVGRGRGRKDERRFEVIAGKVIGAQDSQSRFAFARNNPAIASGAFKQRSQRPA